MEFQLLTIVAVIASATAIILVLLWKLKSSPDPQTALLKQQLIESANKNQEIESKLSLSLSMAERSKAENEAAVANKQQSESRFADLERKHENLVQQNNVSEGRAILAHASFEAATEQLTEARNQISQLQQDTANKATALAEAEAAKKRVLEVEARYHNLEAKATELQGKVEQSSPTIQKAIDEAESVTQRFTEIQQRFLVLQSQYDELITQYQSSSVIAEKATTEKDAALRAKIEEEARANKLGTEYANLRVANSQVIERMATAESAASRWKDEALNFQIEINSLKTELTTTTGKLMEATAKNRTDADAAKLFENVGQTVLRNTLEEAKKGIQGIAEEFHKSSDAELDKHTQKIALTLEPLQTKLAEYDAAVESLKLNSQEVYGGLKQQIEGLQATEQLLNSQAKALTTALSANPKVRGNYGELKLRRLVEFMGLDNKCDFSEQVHTLTEEGRQIPDMIVHLPEGQNVIVDAKAVMNACVEAQQASEDSHRATLLKQHCDNVRSRINELSDKDYAAAHKNATTVVILFIPAENLYATAMEHGPDLTEYAMRKNVIICGPNSLMMLLTVASQIWKRAAIEDEVEKVRTEGNKIYKAMIDFLRNLEKVGRSIKQVSEDYNTAAGTLDGTIIPAGRRLGALGSITAKEEILSLPSIEVESKRYRSEEAKRVVHGEDIDQAQLIFSNGNQQGEN